MVAYKNKRKSIKRGGSATAKRLTALQGPLDFEAFFKNVEKVRKRFEDVIKRGQNVSLMLKKGEKSELVKTHFLNGRFDILLLNTYSVFSRTPIKKMFINNERLIFYRSVYVEHLLKMMDILTIIERAIDNGFTESQDLLKLRDDLFLFKTKLETEEDAKKQEVASIFNDESVLITNYYEKKTQDESVLKLRERSLMAIQRKLERYKKKNKAIQMRMFRQLRRHHFYKDKDKRAIPDMSTTVCNVAKLLLYDKSRSHIVYNGVKYPTQKYNNKDSNLDVKSKIGHVLGFARDNDQFLIDSENDLSTKPKRLAYLSKLKSRGGCNSLIIMLKFFDKSGGGGGRSIFDNSGLADLELPEVPVDAITLDLPDVPQFNSVALGLPSVATDTPKPTSYQRKTIATALTSRLGSKKGRKRKVNKLRKSKGSKKKRN